MLRLLGLHIFETTCNKIEDLGEEHGHRVLQVRGKGDKVGEFSELDSIVAGTGEWIGTTGILRADGTFDGTTGAGKYEAELCNQ